MADRIVPHFHNEPGLPITLDPGSARPAGCALKEAAAA
jgi:hypothetical protein